MGSREGAIRARQAAASHLWSRHEQELRSAGYDTPEQFVHDMANGFTEIRRARDGAYRLVRLDEQGQPRTALIKLRADEAELYHDVATGHPMQRSKLEREPLLWPPARDEGGSPSPSSDLASPAGSPASSSTTGKRATDPEQRLPNIDQSPGQIKPEAGRLANLRRILGNESGSATLGLAAHLGGTSAGALAGAKVDEEHPVRGAVAGGLAGAALGIAAGRALRGRTTGEPTAAETNAAIDDLIATTKRPKGATPGDVNVDDFVNVSKFSFTDAAGEARLRDTVRRLVAERGLTKTPVTWDETKAEAAKLGLRPDDLSRAKASQMSGAQMLAIRNIVSRNLDDMERAGRALVEGGSLTPAERGRLTATLNALDAQNMALLDKFTAARTQAGRDLNNLKIVALRTNDPVAWLARATQWHGGPLEPEVRQQIATLAAQGDVSGFLQLVGTLRKSSTLEKVGTFWKANLLTNPLTHVVNTVSNATLAGAELAKDVPASVFDRLLGLATKERTRSAPGRAQLAASVAGARQGLREAKLVMRGIPLDEALAKWDFPRDTNYDGPAGPLLNAYTRTVFRMLGAADRVFNKAALMGSLANQAKAAGLDVATVLRNPPEDLLTRAITDALQATVQDKTKVGDVLSSLSKAGGGLGGFVVPFSRTPGAVATRVAEYTPIGGLMGGVKGLRVVRAALKGAPLDAAEQREAAKLLGRATTGSGIMALGYWLARKGLMSGTTDQEARGERDTHYLTGRPDNALKVGKTWLEVGRLSPVGMLLAVGANLYDVTQAGATPREALTGIAGTIAKATTDQPFLTGISTALNVATNPTGGDLQRMGENIAIGFIPASAAVGAVARGTDPYVRDASGITERLKARIPGASETLAPMLDQFGQPVAREGGLTDALVNPLRRTTDQGATDPVKAEIARLGVTISRRRPAGARDRAATRDLVQLEGPVVARALAAIVADPRYAALDDDQRRAVIDRTVRYYRTAATRHQKAEAAR
jgi:hypothetical protein